MGLSLSVEIWIVSRWGIVTQSRAAMTAGEVARAADATWIAVGLALSSWIGSHTQVHSIISTPGFCTTKVPSGQVSGGSRRNDDRERDRQCDDT